MKFFLGNALTELLVSTPKYDYEGIEQFFEGTIHRQCHHTNELYSVNPVEKLMVHMGENLIQQMSFATQNHHFFGRIKDQRNRLRAIFCQLLDSLF